jgi:DNA-binding transcriptional MocR family regulator
MSWQALTWATTTETEKPIQKLILMFLANWSDEKGCSYPSKRTLAKYCSCDERTVTRAINDLERLKLISIEFRKRPDGSQTSNNYFLAMGGVKNEGGGVSKLHSLNTLDNTLINTNTKKQNKNTYTEIFEEFWEAYPPRPNDNKWSASIAFEKTNDISDSRLIELAKIYRGRSINTEPKFIPMASTWLNQKRYNDLLDAKNEELSKTNKNLLAG